MEDLENLIKDKQSQLNNINEQIKKANSNKNKEDLLSYMSS